MITEPDFDYWKDLEITKEFDQKIIKKKFIEIKKKISKKDL